MISCSEALRRSMTSGHIKISYYNDQSEAATCNNSLNQPITMINLAIHLQRINQPGKLNSKSYFPRIEYFEMHQPWIISLTTQCKFYI